VVVAVVAKTLTHYVHGVLKNGLKDAPEWVIIQK